jgi:hypothetical protein
MKQTSEAVSLNDRKIDLIKSVASRVSCKKSKGSFGGWLLNGVFVLAIGIRIWKSKI